jgi:hypothetical protein
MPIATRAFSSSCEMCRSIIRAGPVCQSRRSIPGKRTGGKNTATSSGSDMILPKGSLPRLLRRFRAAPESRTQGRHHRKVYELMRAAPGALESGTCRVQPGCTSQVYFNYTRKFVDGDRKIRKECEKRLRRETSTSN